MQRLIVNRKALALNKQLGNTEKPPFVLVGEAPVRSQRSIKRGHALVLRVGGKIIGRAVYQPDDPHRLHAVVWLEFEDNVGIEVL